MAAVPRWLLVLVLGTGLFLPMLGSYGLWDPIEIQHADVAQDLLAQGKYLNAAADARLAPRPHLYLWLLALSFKLLGVNELAGRLPIALVSVLALLIAYRVGRRLLSEKVGLGAAFVLATTPCFIFQSRLIASDVLFYASLLASAGGLAAYLFPASGRRSLFDLALGGLGLLAGFLSRGLVLGAGFPLAAFAITVALSARTPNAPDELGLYPSAGGRHIGANDTVGRALRSAIVPILVTILLVAGAIAALFVVLKPTLFLIWGAELRRQATPPTFETAFKELGFGFYPWFALLPIALAQFVSAQASDASVRTRDAFTKCLVLVMAVFGYLATSFWSAFLSKAHYPGLPFLALGVGVLLYEAWSGRRVHRLYGVVAAGFILALQQDFFMAPESLAFSHLLDPAKYPIELNIKLATRIFGFLLAALVFLAFGGAPHIVSLDFRGKVFGPILRGGGRVLNLVSDAIAFIGGKKGSRFFFLVAATSLAFAIWCSFWLVPKLSLHLSNKNLFDTFHRCRSGGEKLAQYQVTGRGAAYYNKGTIEDVQDQGRLFTLLREAHRWFILIPTGNLAAIDQAARRENLTYYVLDDRNSQYFIVSNKLEGRCKQDLNPLRRYVLSKPPKIGKPLAANFENKVQLLGYDVADVVTRGGKFTITLYFHVLTPMPAGWKLFIHFDQPANRFHGDHEPLDGKLPTQFWLPGDYIIDPHDVEIPLITTPSGEYQIFVGFWEGDNRLKVVEGPNDGVNRVPIGNLRVR
jgi:hypothetical protein